MPNLYYFAYGSNMSEQVFHERAVGQSVGPAVLLGHRLAFTLPSQRWGGRAADLAFLDGAATWGRLWLVNDEHLEVLDRLEGAYRRLDVTVEQINETNGEIRTEEIPAITYVVQDSRRAPVEDVPAPRYLQHLLEGAAECGIPEYYIRFLRAVSARPAGELRVVGTSDRSAARGFPLARVHPARKPFRSRLGYVEVAGRYCLVHIEPTHQVPEGTLEVDQRVREALGIGGRLPPGWPARIGFVSSSRRHWLGIIPRSVVLPLYRASKSDAELRSAVLHERLLGALGLNSGDHIELLAVRPPAGDGGKATLRRTSARIHSGVGNELRREGMLETDYPRVSEVYGDLDIRRALGVERDEVRTPVIVRPDVWRLFRSRLWIYLLTTLLGYEVFDTVLAQLDVATTWTAWAHVSLVGAMALATAVVTAWFDLRGRVGR